MHNRMALDEEAPLKAIAFMTWFWKFIKIHYLLLLAIRQDCPY